MHGQPREEGPLLQTEVVLDGVREVVVTEIEDPDAHIPRFERRLYVHGVDGQSLTVILRATPGRPSSDLNISFTYGGGGSSLAS